MRTPFKLRRQRTTEDFILESNAIEGIYQDITKEDIDEHNRFMHLKEITVDDLLNYLAVHQPDAELRDKKGMNVRIGSYYPPVGGPDITARLSLLLDEINNHEISPWKAHVRYEQLHPFTDGNGRSGRMIWAWMHRDLTLGFLHMFYYQTLSYDFLKE